MYRAAVITILLCAASAEARTAFVDLSPEVLEALDLESKKLEPVDVAQEHRHLQEGTLNVVFPDEPVPAWATPEMKKDWESGAAGCRAKVGPPPYAGRPPAVFCGMALASALWQRHLERIDAAGLVLTGGYGQDYASKLFKISVMGYRVDEPATRKLEATAKTRKEALARTVELLGRLIAGQGNESPRQLVRTLETAAATSATARLVPAEFKPSPVPAECQETLPRRLELGADQASVDLDRLWTVSVPGGKAPPRACTLTYRTETADLAGTQVFVGRGSLDCPPDRFETKSSQLLVAATEEKVLRGLLDQALKAWCK